MKIIVNGSKLGATIKNLEGLTGGATELVTLKYDGKHSLWLYQEAKTSEAIKVGLRIDVNGKKSGTITVNASVLAGICRRNAELLLEYKGKELHVTDQKKYKAKCMTVKSEQTTKIISKKLAKTALSQDFQDILLDAVTHLTIKDFFQSETPIVLSCWASKKKKTWIGASDSYHGGLYIGKSTVDIEFHLPMAYALRLSSLLTDNEGVAIGVDDNSFYLWNDDMQVSWPLVAPKATLEQFKGVMSPANTAIAEFELGNIKTILSNLKPLYEKLSYLAVKMSKKDMTMSVRSTKGQASEVIKPESGNLPKAELAINILLLEDLISLLPPRFNLGLTQSDNGNFISMVFSADQKHGSAVYHAMLSTK